MIISQGSVHLLISTCVLPDLRYLTSDRLSHFSQCNKSSSSCFRLTALWINKAHGHDDISVNMIKLPDDDIDDIDMQEDPCHWYLLTPLSGSLLMLYPFIKENYKQNVGNYRPISWRISDVK